MGVVEGDTTRLGDIKAVVALFSPIIHLTASRWVRNACWHLNTFSEVPRFKTTDLALFFSKVPSAGLSFTINLLEMLALAYWVRHRPSKVSLATTEAARGFYRQARQKIQCLGSVARSPTQMKVRLLGISEHEIVFWSAWGLSSMFGHVQNQHAEAQFPGPWRYTSNPSWGRAGSALSANHFLVAGCLTW